MTEVVGNASVNWEAFAQYGAMGGTVVFFMIRDIFIMAKLKVVVEKLGLSQEKMASTQDKLVGVLGAIVSKVMHGVGDTSA